MIVRISSEGQYRLSSALLDQVNEMDNALVEMIAECDEAEFKAAFHKMLDLIREQGKEVAIDELVESHVILPRPETTVDEARRFFTGDGLFPDDDD